MTVQRVAGLVEADVIGQLDGQVFLLLRHHAAAVAMHHGNRAPPVALTGQAPIAQAELGHTLAPPGLFGKVDGGVDGFLPRGLVQPREVVDPLHFLVLRRHEGLCFYRGLIVESEEGVDDRQVVLAAEVEVALIVRGAAEDGSRAVIHQDEVRDPDRQFPVRIKRMLHPDAGIEAQLLGCFDGFLGGAALARFLEERGQLGVVLLHRLGNRMIGRNADEACPHQGVGAGGIDRDRITRVGAFEAELKAARLADPVFLHEPDLGRPVIQRAERIQQIFREIGDLEEPLGQFAPFDQRARPPATAVLDLLIGQHRHVDRVPVHHRVLSVNQPLFQEVEEECLLLAVIFGVAGGKHARPVQRQAKRLHLLDHRVDVGIGPILGVAANCHRRVLGRHPEGVEPHRVQHVMPGRNLVAGDHVAHRVVAHMAHVQFARRIGEHLEHVVFRLALVALGLEQLGLLPGCLPFRFGHARVETGHGLSLSSVIRKRRARRPGVCLGVWARGI